MTTATCNMSQCETYRSSIIWVSFISLIKSQFQRYHSQFDFGSFFNRIFWDKVLFFHSRLTTEKIVCYIEKNISLAEIYKKGQRVQKKPYQLTVFDTIRFCFIVLRILSDRYNCYWKCSWEYKILFNTQIQTFTNILELRIVNDFVHTFLLSFFMHFMEWHDFGGHQSIFIRIINKK